EPIPEPIPEPMLIWDKVPRSLTSADLLLVLQDVPKRNGRLVVVMDNGSMHVSHVIKEALPALKEEGIEFYYLPPYSPELNDIELHLRLLQDWRPGPNMAGNDRAELRVIHRHEPRHLSELGRFRKPKDRHIRLVH